MKAVHVVVHGRVQGVGYRAWTEGEALRRGLDGWVRNRRDGTVEAVIAGEAGKIDEMVGHLRQGPPASRVKRVEIVPAADPVQPGFSVLPTA